MRRPETGLRVASVIKCSERSLEFTVRFLLGFACIAGQMVYAFSVCQRKGPKQVGRGVVVMGESDKRCLKAKYIVVWNNNRHEVLENGYLGIDGGSVSGFGRTPPMHSVSVEDLGDALITPGFINIHCHPSGAAPIHKSYFEDTGSSNFYQSILYEHEMALKYSDEDAEDVARSTLAALLLSGCTTVVDPGSSISERMVSLVGEMGMRAYVGAPYRSGLFRTEDGHSLVYSLDEAKGMERLAEAIELVEHYNGSHEGRVCMLLGPTMTTTCAPGVLRETRKAADRLGVGITIHAAEGLMEFQECIRRYGRTPIQLLSDTGLLGPDLIIAHAAFVSGHSRLRYPGNDDLRLLAESKSTVAHCPWVFVLRGFAVESYPRYLSEGINVGIGTDAFNLDYLQEMRWACGVGKIVERSCSVATARDAFDSATVAGSQALKRPDLGRLAPGAQADVVVFRLDSFEMAPVRDPIRNLVYSGTRHDVDQVYVQGRCLVRDGRVLGLEEKPLIRRLQEVGTGAWSHAPECDWNKRSVDELSPLSLPKCEIDNWQ